MKRIKIKVTQEDIDGASYDVTPIEVACKRQWPNTEVGDRLGDLLLDGYALEIPYYPSLWVSYYYDGYPVEPMEFEIRMPLFLRIKLWWKNLR